MHMEYACWTGSTFLVEDLQQSCRRSMSHFGDDSTESVCSLCRPEPHQFPKKCRAQRGKRLPLGPIDHTRTRRLFLPEFDDWLLLSTLRAYLMETGHSKLSPHLLLSEETPSLSYSSIVASTGRQPRRSHPARKTQLTLSDQCTPMEPSASHVSSIVRCLDSAGPALELTSFAFGPQIPMRQVINRPSNRPSAATYQATNCQYILQAEAATLPPSIECPACVETRIYGTSNMDSTQCSAFPFFVVHVESCQRRIALGFFKSAPRKPGEEVDQKGQAARLRGLLGSAADDLRILKVIINPKL